MSHYVFQFERGERFLKPLTRETGRKHRRERSGLMPPLKTSEEPGAPLESNHGAAWIAISNRRHGRS
jgi:hypothetical protein